MVPHELRHSWRSILSPAALRKKGGGRLLINEARKGNYLMERKEDEKARVFSVGKTKKQWTWMTIFNSGKCQIRHLGRTNPGSMDRLGSQMLGNSATERDLGVLVDAKLDMCKQGPGSQKGHPCAGAHQEQHHPGYPATAHPACWVWCLGCVD